MKRLSWERYALELAIVASMRSEDPYLKVGACALRKDNSVAGMGYNGAPPEVEIDWSNRGERRKRVIHAEVNALRYVQPGECRLLACTHMPCNECLRMIAAYGIKKIIYNNIYEKDLSSVEISSDLGVTLEKIK